MKGYKVKCWECNGTGEIFRPIKNRDGKVEHFVRERCQSCQGSGMVQSIKKHIPQ